MGLSQHTCSCSCRPVFPNDPNYYYMSVKQLTDTVNNTTPLNQSTEFLFMLENDFFPAAVETECPSYQFFLSGPLPTLVKGI